MSSRQWYHSPTAILSDTDTEDEEEETIPRWTKLWVEQDRKFIPTAASRLIEKTLERHNRVVLFGGTGCGKSAIARHVALKYARRKIKIVVVQGFSDIKRAQLSSRSVLFVIDDPIGKTAVDEKACRSWYFQRKYLDGIFKGQTDRNKTKLPKVIVTCQSNLVGSEQYDHFKHYKSINIDCKELKLTKEEKSKIFKRHIESLNLRDEHFEETMKWEKAFPLLTNLGSAIKTADMLAFFKDPLNEVKKELQTLKTMAKIKYLCLFLLVLHGNRLSVVSFVEDDDKNELDEPIEDNEDEDEKVRDEIDEEDGNENNFNYDCPMNELMLADLFNTLSISPNTSKVALFDAIKSLRGRYFVKVMEGNLNLVRRQDKILKITNDSFLRMVIVLFYQEFPDKFIKYCQSDFFRTMTTCEKVKPKDWVSVSLDDSSVKSFLDRIESDINQGTFLDVFLSPWIRDDRVQDELISRLESMTDQKMLQFVLKSTLNQDVELENYVGDLKNYTRLDLIFTCKDISVIVLSLLLNMDKLFIAMFNLVQKCPKGLCLDNAPLVSACCINGRKDLLKMITNTKALENDCWSQKECISALHIAANFLQTDILSELLETGCDVNMMTQYKQSALFLAASTDERSLQYIRFNGSEKLVTNSSKLENARSKVISMLTRKSSNINGHPEMFPCALAFLCKRGNIEAVKTLLAEGANVNETSNEKKSSLHFASKSGNIKIVKTLIDKQSDVNLKTRNGLSALYFATLKGHDEIIDLLLSKGTRAELKEKYGNNPFFVACQQGRTKLVKKFLQHNPFINCALANGISALMVAVDTENYALTEILLENGADAKIIRTDDGFHPIHVAAELGNETIVKILLKHGSDVECLTSNNSSPLIVAAENGREAVVKLLLERGTIASCLNNSSKTPLIYAAGNGHLDVARLLLQNKADVNLITKDGNSALTLASCHGHESVVLELIKQFANINQQTKGGATSLLLASENGHTETVNTLLTNKADVNLCKKGGITPLYIASCQGNYEIVKELLQYEKEVNDSNPKHLLSIATKNGHEKIVQILIEKGVNVNVCDEDGLTPLLIAAKKGYSNIVKILLDNGAETAIVRNPDDEDDDDDDEENDDDEKNALHYACEKGNADVVRVLLDYGMDINAHVGDSPTPLYLALDTGRSEVALLLIRKGADINIIVDSETSLYTACRTGLREAIDVILERGGEVNPKVGPPPLAAAVFNDHYKIVERLITCGADVNAKLSDPNCPSVLMRAVSKDFTKIIKLLLEHGAQINTRNSSGLTALHVNAYHSFSVAALSVLLEYKAETNSRTNNGETPLILAVQEKTATKRRVDLLMAHGADVNAHDKDGDTALHLACEYGFVGIVKILLHHGGDKTIKNNKGLSPLNIADAKEHGKVKKILSEWKTNITPSCKSTNVTIGNERDIVVARRHPLDPALPRRSSQSKIKKTWRSN